MMAPVMRVPNGPALVMENVPALMSSRLRRLFRAPVGDVSDPTGHAPQVELLGIVHDRDDESLVVEIDGNTQVDVAVHDQRVVPDRCVEVRELFQGIDRGTGGERKVRQAEALLGPEALPMGAPHLFDTLVIDLLDHEGVSRGRLGADHVLGGPPADIGEGHHLVAVGGPGAGRLVGRASSGGWCAGCRRGGGRRHSRRWRWGCRRCCRTVHARDRSGLRRGGHAACGDERLDVGASDPPSEPGAADVGPVDPVLRQELPDHWGQDHALN
jgi:hypothetical protein